MEGLDLFVARIISVCAKFNTQGLVVLFFIHTDTYLNEFNRPLQISNVLYSDSGNLTATGSKDQKTIELCKALFGRQ